MRIKGVIAKGLLIAFALTLTPTSTYGTDHAGPKTPSCGNFKVTKNEVIVGVKFPKGTYQINTFGISCSKVMGSKGLFSKFLKLKNKDPLPKPWRYLADAVGAPKFSSGPGVGFRVQLLTPTPTPTPTPTLTPDPVVSENSVYANSSFCKLPYTYQDTDNYLGFPRTQGYIPSIGERKSIVLFVDFDDLVADKKAIDTWKNIQIPVAKKAFSRLSYGKYKISFDVNEKIYRLPGSYKAFARSEYVNIAGSTPGLGLEYGKFVQSAVTIADNDVDFSKYDFVNVVTPTFSPKAEGGATGGSGFNSDGKTSFLSTVGPIDEYVDDPLKSNWLLHEVGHLLGLTHVYDYLPRNIGAWDPMGNVFGLDELHGWQRWYLDWIDDSQVACLDESAPKESVHLISPLATSTKRTKSVILKLSPSSALAIEVMRSSPENTFPSAYEGVVVYKIDTKLPGGKGSISIISNAGKSQPTKGGRAGLIGTLSVGESVKYEEYTIKVLKNSTEGDYVSISKVNG